tara:strand:- start:1390 stop:3201 length:1812 start_codon:yes stop_codon:yes gene_type:complete
MRVYGLVFLFLVVSLKLFGQDTHDNNFYEIPFSVFVTEVDTISYDNLATLDFKPKAHFVSTYPDEIYWAKFDFSRFDSSLLSKNLYLQMGVLDKAEIFFQNNFSVKSKVLGAFELNQDYTGEFPFHKDNLIDGRYLYLKFSVLDDRISLKHKTFVFYGDEDKQIQEDYVFKGTYKIHTLIYLLLGLALVAFVMALAFYRVHRRKEYLYYALYVLGLMISLWRIPSSFYHEHVGLYSLYNFVFVNTLDLTIAIFYLLFARYFLNTPLLYPFIDKVIGIYLIGLFSLLLIDTIVISQGYYSLHSTLVVFKLGALFVLEVVGAIYLFTNRKDKLTWFILSGSILFTIGSILAFLFFNSNFLKAAAFTEIFVFFVALAFKIQKENEEKIQFQEDSFQNYRNLLRTQINPHFIFNSLNSIQNLINSNNRVSAMKYLSKFSKLLRQTLESSIENNISLAEEIDFLKRYLELESLRFENAFTYNISVDINIISPEDIEMPQLMIQPFVENAIIHGLLNKKEGERVLNISFSKQDNFLLCTIDDNGVGRHAAKQYKKTSEKRKSRGMEVTQKRIDTLYSKEIEDQLLQIIDKTDSDGNPSGTTIILKIPLS